MAKAIKRSSQQAIGGAYVCVCVYARAVMYSFASEGKFISFGKHLY